MIRQTTLFLAIALPLAFSISANAQTKTIPETAVEAGEFKTLVAAAKAAGILNKLSGDGPFTVLAPTDKAFQKLPNGTVENLLKPENKDKLVAILKLHVAKGELMSDMAEPDSDFPSLAGPLKVNVKGKEIMVGAAKVAKADVVCSNGVIHVIDTVLLPETPLEPKMLVGKWTYTKAIKNGGTRTAEVLADQSIKITKDSWTLNGPMKFVMDYKIDTKSKPNKIKFTITESPFGAGMSAGGVIKMERDQLVVCYSPMGKPPTDFAAKAGSGHHAFFLKKSETEER